MTTGTASARLLIVGGGRMGEAIVAGLLDSGAFLPAQVVVAEPVESRREQLAASLGVVVCADGAEAQGAVHTVIIAVKPQVIESVVTALAPSIAGSTVVSIAAGVSCARLESWLAPGTPVVRVMPNTPALVGSGMSIVSGGTHASPAQVDAVAALFASVGAVVVLDERLQEACTAISGCGPAYMALVIEALALAAEQEGLDRDVAQTLALATMRGTVDLIERTGESPEAVIRAVSSPGGATIAALAELESHGLREAFAAAVRAAAARSRELGAQ